MSEEASPGLHVEQRGGVAWLTLDRPDCGNALDLPTAEALLAAATSCDEDDTVRCVVLRGRGRMFCSGGDVAAFAEAGEALPEYLLRLTDAVHAAVVRLAQLDKPLVVAVNGPAAGAGFSLALLGDLAIAASSAHFTLAYTQLGLTLDTGATWFLPRIVGFRRAQEIAATNRRISAAEALELSLVTQVVADEAFQTTVEDVTARFVSSAGPAIAATRRLFLSAQTADLETQLEREGRAIADAARTAVGREGIRAFLDKRPPDFV